MKTYKVLQHPTKELKAVKSGFAWLAIPFVTFLPIFPAWFLISGVVENIYSLYSNNSNLG